MPGHAVGAEPLVGEPEVRPEDEPPLLQLRASASRCGSRGRCPRSCRSEVAQPQVEEPLVVPVLPTAAPGRLRRAGPSTSVRPYRSPRPPSTPQWPFTAETQKAKRPLGSSPRLCGRKGERTYNRPMPKGERDGEDALGREVNTLGRLLGDVLREQEGGAGFPLVEEYRARTKALRAGEGSPARLRAQRRGRCSSAPEASPPTRRGWWCAPSPPTSTSSTWPRSATACASCAGGRRTRETPRGASRSRRRWRRRPRAGVAGGGACARCSPAARWSRSSPPTPPRPAGAPCSTKLRRLQRPGRGPGERRARRRGRRRELHDRIREEITALWLTDEVRRRAPTVLDEVRNGLYYFEQSLWDVVPRLYRDAGGGARGDAYPGERLRRCPPFLRFGSWIGGDRDGNPRRDGRGHRAHAAPAQARRPWRSTSGRCRGCSATSAWPSEPRPAAGPLRRRRWPATSAALPGRWRSAGGAPSPGASRYRRKVGFMLARAARGAAPATRTGCSARVRPPAPARTPEPGRLPERRPGGAPARTTRASPTRRPEDLLADLAVAGARPCGARGRRAPGRRRAARPRPAAARSSASTSRGSTCASTAASTRRRWPRCCARAGVEADYLALAEAERAAVLARELANPRPLIAAHAT